MQILAFLCMALAFILSLVTVATADNNSQDAASSHSTKQILALIEESRTHYRQMAGHMESPSAQVLAKAEPKSGSAYVEMSVDDILGSLNDVIPAGPVVSAMKNTIESGRDNEFYIGMDKMNKESCRSTISTLAADAATAKKNGVLGLVVNGYSFDALNDAPKAAATCVDANRITLQLQKNPQATDE